jgi:hypothetical protein
VIVPTAVREDVTIVEGSDVPVRPPAGVVTATVLTLVMRPLPFTVMIGMAVEDPKLPVLLLTDARVSAPPELRVASPDIVSASRSPLLSVPIRYAERTPVSFTVAAVNVVVIVT